MRNIERTLRTLRFFHGLGDDFISKLADCAMLVDFEPNELLIRAGGRPDRFYVVVSGGVAVELDDEGRTRVQTLGPDDVLGCSFLTPEHPWLFSVRAVEPTAAVVFDGAMVMRACDAHTGLGYELMRRFIPVLTLRLRGTLLRLVNHRAPV